ncbi:GNAT family N-acetyltransferase [Metabacillus sp. RGM 3146]|uniref:GNAT family N-acetyltransferase n=1 Tax=Metabacillus sp. RGM 3146 TaxID=3401092 RepID=UPI003B99DB83
MEILTERLLVIPCSLDIAKSLIIHRKELEERSPINIPDTWPSPLTTGVLPLYIERLEENKKEYGWGLWLIIHTLEKKIIGDFYIEAKPDQNGRVEFHFQMDKAYPEMIAFEAANMFFNWLFEQKEVKCIYTECRSDQEKTIALFNKLGFICSSKDDLFLQWRIAKNESC